MMSELSLSSIEKWQVLKPIKVWLDNSIVELVYVFGETGEEVICITTEDNVYAFGKNCGGVLGLGHKNAVNEPTIVEELCGKQIICIVCNTINTCFVLAISKCGQTYSWGANKFGYLGNGATKSSYNPNLITALKDITVIDICCGINHCLALTQTGEVYAWGYNTNGECGNGNNSTQLTPIKVRNLDNIKITAIACGGHHSLALTECGLVYGWGCNTWGQLGIGNTTNQSSPSLLNNFDINISKICAGFQHSLFLSSNGDVYGCGDNKEGQIGDHNNEVNYPLPIMVEFLWKMTDIEAVPQRNISMAVSVFKRCFMWGMKKSITPSEVTQSSLNETLNVTTTVKITVKPVKLIESRKQSQSHSKHNYLFNNSDYSDIKIKIDGKYIYAHKLYLIKVCKHFEQMFADIRWLESGAEEIEITQYSYGVYHSFLKYLYNKVIDSNESLESLVQLLDLANSYLEEDLKYECEELVKSRIGVNNVCELYSIAVRYDSQPLQDYCLDYSADKINRICFTDGYLQMFANDSIAGKMFKKYFTADN